MAGELKVTLEMSGGAELLFNNVKEHIIRLPCSEKRSGLADGPVTHDSVQWDMRRLLAWIKDNLLKERPELFLKDTSVRPGILVLINDSDWELLGQLDYVVQDDDRITFISTLHGG